MPFQHLVHGLAERGLQRPIRITRRQICGGELHMALQFCGQRWQFQYLASPDRCSLLRIRLVTDGRPVVRHWQLTGIVRLQGQCIGMLQPLLPPAVLLRAARFGTRKRQHLARARHRHVKCVRFLALLGLQFLLHQRLHRRWRVGKALQEHQLCRV